MTVSALSACGAPARSSGTQDAVSRAEAAAIWGFPLVLTGRYLKRSQGAGFGLNRFYLNQTLATPSLHVVGPNVDTIYGFAWLDLAHEPIVVGVPEANDRYYSIQLIDAYANTFAYIGRRETGTHAGSFAIVPPGWTGTLPANVQRLNAPTGLVLAFTRTLVRGGADLAAAQALQLRYTLGPLSAFPSGQRPGEVHADALNVFPRLDLAGAGGGYFSELAALVSQYPPQGPEAERLAGFGAGAPAFADLTDVQRGQAFTQALARINAFNASEVEDGWRVNLHISKYIADPLARAAANRFGPGTHIAEEALYFSASADAAGASLTGARPVTLRFLAGQTPPVDAFWSLILYDQNFFLFENPLHRYTINDRTDGLVHEADGGLSIVISATKPQRANVNWLPAPQGPYQLVLRTYQPKPSILDKTYQVPPLQSVQS